MRLVTFEVNGSRRLGFEQNGQIIDLVLAYSLLVDRRGPHPGGLRALPPDMLTFIRIGTPALAAARDTFEFMKKRPAAPVGEQLSYPPDIVKLRPPVSRPGKILASASTTGEPRFYAKFASTLIGPGDPIFQPRNGSRLLARPSLCAVVGTPIRNATAQSAAPAIFGYTLLNDISVPGMLDQPAIARNFDTFCPLGPCLVRADEFATEELGPIWERLFETISFLSKFLTLGPGDLVSTPVSDEPGELQAGSKAAVQLEGIGLLENPVLAEPLA